MTDFGQIKNYAGYIKEDPFRRGLHFPAVEQILGDLSKKRILDIGCGDGLFPRLLAERGIGRRLRQGARNRAVVPAPRCGLQRAACGV